MANFTANEIKKTFVKLLNTKPYNKITVKDIVEECGINRNSFYYHFADIPTLVGTIFVDENTRIMNNHPTIDSLHEFIDEITSTCLKNRQAILNLFNSSNRALYEDYGMRICVDAVTKYFNQAFNDYEVDQDEHYLAIQVGKCTLFGICIDWANKGLDEEAVAEMHATCDLLHGIPNLIFERMRIKK